jgi:hypothetical protein
MKIVPIFADKLFAFHYKGEAVNEFDRLMDLWTDIAFLIDYLKENNITNVKKIVKDILQDAEQIQDFLDNISQNKEPYGFYFEPLQNSERNKILAFQKGKIKENILRYYAIKLDENCFVITGGAIKMSQKMQEHPDTTNELKKLEKARAYLKQNGVFDEDSFFELLIEQQ